MARGRIGAVKSGQVMFGFEGCIRVVMKEQSNGIIFFIFCKDYFDCWLGNQRYLVI